MELIRIGVKNSKGELTLPDKNLHVNPTSEATLQDSRVDKGIPLNTFEPEAGLCQAEQGDSQQHPNTKGDHNQAAGKEKSYKQYRDLQEINNHKSA